MSGTIAHARWELGAESKAGGDFSYRKISRARGLLRVVLSCEPVLRWGGPENASDVCASTKINYFILFKYFNLKNQVLNWRNRLKEHNERAY